MYILTEEHKKQLTENINRGVSFLEENRPKWKKEIDWEAFVFVEQSNCIMGQLQLFIPAHITQSSLGFDVPTHFDPLCALENHENCPWLYMDKVWRKLGQVA